MGANRGPLRGSTWRRLCGPQGRWSLEPVRQLFGFWKQDTCALNDWDPSGAICAAGRQGRGGLRFKVVFGLQCEVNQTTGKNHGLRAAQQRLLADGKQVVEGGFSRTTFTGRAPAPGNGNCLKDRVERRSGLVLRESRQGPEQFSQRGYDYIELHGSEEKAAVRRIISGSGIPGGNQAGGRVEDPTQAGTRRVGVRANAAGGCPATHT